MNNRPADYKIYDESKGSTESEENYHVEVRRKVLYLLVTLFFIIIAVFATLILGNMDYSISEIFKSLFTHDTTTTIGRFVWNIDLPIIAAALITGAGLSLAGVVMQCILKNPLASPYTLGLSNAAAFGAAFSFIFFNGGAAFSSIFGTYFTPLMAFIFAMVATGIIIILTRVTRISSETMVLAGIAVSAIFSACLTLMQYIADPVQLSSIVSWTFGTVSYTSWSWDLFLFIVLILVFIYFYINRWNLNAMNAGDEVAKGLGVNTDRFLTIGMILSALLAAVVVSRFGVIAFVGLLGPHMARMVVGDDHRFLIPMSILLGALLLIIANTVALNIVRPMVLPVGLLTSLLGGPAFVCLLIKRYRR